MKQITKRNRIKRNRIKRNKTKKCLLGGNVNACESNFDSYNIDNYKILINSIIDFYLVGQSEKYETIKKEYIINYEINKYDIYFPVNEKEIFERIQNIIIFDNKLKKIILNLINEITEFYLSNNNNNNKYKILKYYFNLKNIKNINLLTNIQKKKLELIKIKNDDCLSKFITSFEKGNNTKTNYTKTNYTKTNYTKTNYTKTDDNTFYKKILIITKIIKDEDDNYERNQDIMLNFKYLIENKTIDFENKKIQNLLIQILLGDKKKELLKDKKKEENIL